MYVLNKLWAGEISPMERLIRPGSEYEKTMAKLCDKMDAFLDTLPLEAQIQAEELENLKSDANQLAEEDLFLYGFRMGARMILDIIGDHKGQFRELTER